jgi:ResB-like family protein
MRNESKLLRFLLRSPLPLIIFIIIPAALILGTTLHFPLPFRITKRMLLINNVGLLLFLAARVLYYLSGLRRAIRYGEATRPSAGALTPARPAEQIRDELSGAGFHWNTDGSYAEKHDRGYLGTVLVYVGLFLLLFIGTWENMCQFSGTLLHGIGMPADLSSRGAYFPLLKGPLASTAGLPKLEVTKQIFASSAYPKGSSDIVLWSKDGKPVGSATLVGSGEPYRYKGYDIFLAKQLVDVALNLRSKDNPDKIIFYDSVKFSPLWKKEGDYSMYAAFRTPEGHDGEGFYNPDKKAFKFIMTREGKKVLDTEYILHQYRKKEVGDFVMSIDAMGNWSEIHVVRRRHMELLWVGGFIALLGLIMRIAFRPQRVWLEETPEGCRVWVAGKNPLRVEQRHVES